MSIVTQYDAFSDAVPYVVDGGYLSAVFGVSSRQVRNYASDGMPQIGRDKYDIRHAVAWWIEAIKTPGKTTTEVTARARLAEAQRERVELDIERQRGEVVDAQLVKTCFDKIATTIASQHDGFSARNAATLASESDPAAIQRYLFAELREMRRQIARQFDAIAGFASRSDGAKRARKAPAKSKKTPSVKPKRDN